MIENEKGETITKRIESGWRMCIDYRKLNKATRKDHFPLPFIYQMLERLAKQSHFCYLDGYSGFFQIPIHPDVLLVPSLIDECRLACAMLPQPSKGA